MHQDYGCQNLPTYTPEIYTAGVIFYQKIVVLTKIAILDQNCDS